MIAVIAQMSVAEGKEAEFERTMAELAAQVRAEEPDCSLYQLCKAGEPGRYVMLERYASQEALGTHAKSAHFKAAMPKLGELLTEPPRLEILTEIGNQ